MQLCCVIAGNDERADIDGRDAREMSRFQCCWTPSYLFIFAPRYLTMHFVAIGSRPYIEMRPKNQSSQVVMWNEMPILAWKPNGFHHDWTSAVFCAIAKHANVVVKYQSVRWLSRSVQVRWRKVAKYTQKQFKRFYLDDATLAFRPNIMSFCEMWLSNLERHWIIRAIHAPSTTCDRALSAPFGLSHVMTSRFAALHVCVHFVRFHRRDVNGGRQCVWQRDPYRDRYRLI